VNIIFPKSSVKYVNLQCNSALDDYRKCPELASVLDLLSTIKPKRVLELGAGLGRISVFLKNYFNWDDTEFYLLDGDSGEKQIAGIHWKTKKDFYNSITATRNFCLNNNVKSEKLFLVNAESPTKFGKKKFDLCYSFKAFGFHWPIETYLDIFSANFEKDAYLVFELRSIERDAYATQERYERAKRFVINQMKFVEEHSLYNIIDIKKEYPILILQKNK